jgi:hypothetical protein
MFALGLGLILLGLVILVFGTRMVILGAGVGALLGIGFLRILPGTQESALWLIIPIGLAILFAFGAGIAKGMVSLVTLALGALAGGAIALAVLDLFGLDLGLTNWIIALVGAVIGAGLMSRFKTWAVIILASLVGALLSVRGLQMLVPAVQGIWSSLIGLVLLGGGIVFHGGFFGKRKST